MFGLGFWETVVIAVVILIAVRPEDLPVFLRKIGRLIGRARNAYETLKRGVILLDRKDDAVKREESLPDQSAGRSPYPAIRRRKRSRSGKKPKVKLKNHPEVNP